MENKPAQWIRLSINSILVLIDYDSLHPQAQYFYEMDRPVSLQKQTTNYAFGVSELLAVDGAYLLVLERELLCSKKKIGLLSTTNSILFLCLWEEGSMGLDSIGTVHKSLLHRVGTRWTLTFVVSPTMKVCAWGAKTEKRQSGCHLIADSQNRYLEMLKRLV